MSRSKTQTLTNSHREVSYQDVSEPEVREEQEVVSTKEVEVETYDEGQMKSEEYKEYKNKEKKKKESGRKKGWGYASMYLWFIVAPIVIWIILFTAKPSLVTDNLNGQVVINNQKLALWTLIFSIVAWVFIYAIYYIRY